MPSGTSQVWIRSADGELLRSDVITWLRCRGGDLQAARPDGSTVRLAGPGCPPDFQFALLRELEPHSSWHDDRWIVVITAELAPGGARWASNRLGELTEISDQSG